MNNTGNVYIWTIKRLAGDSTGHGIHVQGSNTLRRIVFPSIEEIETLYQESTRYNYKQVIADIFTKKEDTPNEVLVYAKLRNIEIVHSHK